MYTQGVCLHNRQVDWTWRIMGPFPPVTHLVLSLLVGVHLEHGLVLQEPDVGGLQLPTDGFQIGLHCIHLRQNQNTDTKQIQR